MPYLNHSGNIPWFSIGFLRRHEEQNTVIVKKRICLGEITKRRTFE